MIGEVLLSILQELSSVVGDRTEAANRNVVKKCLQNLNLLPTIAIGLSSEEVTLVGDCAEVLTKVAQERPELVVPYFSLLQPLLTRKTTRIRWESMHAIALITPNIPERVFVFLSLFQELIGHDPSTIVRDYAIETIANLAKTNNEMAVACYPILKESLHVWQGKHRGRALKGMVHVVKNAPEYALEIRMIVEDYIHDNRGVIKKAAKILMKEIEQETK